jgi:formate hydrogenlyase subunit 3/multisubunit Na+/H+ antiporter MnhD subunit
VTDSGLAHLGPLLLVVVPFVGAFLLVPAARRGRAVLDAAALTTTAIALAGALALLPAVLAHGRVTASLPLVLGQLTFSIDGMGLLFALVTTFLWLCATLHAGDYLRHDARPLRYHLTSLVALTAMLGLVAAGDIVTLYVFFEWLGLSAYLLVVHAGGAAAERAGIKYLVMTLLGGFAVLAGVLLVHALGGGDLASPLAFDAGRAGLRSAAAALLVLGFGVKAGALGLHIWLPDAHTAAPAPASALLSGIMIKAGAYGILRTVGALYGTEVEAAAEAVRQGEVLGLALLGWGTATMSFGVVMALWQREAKRLLAYSSVSQMGFILVGIGAARFLGDDGAIGYTGALLHVVNHGLFKALLFLAMGAVIHATGTGDLTRLGGLARRMPWTFVFVVVAAAGITGVPFFNGFVSKSVLHHALEYAAAAGHGTALGFAERVFTLTTVGTAAALIKLLTMVFLGKPRSPAPATVGEAPRRMLAAMGLLSLAVVSVGLRPQALAPLLTRALETARLPTLDVERWLTSPIGHPGDLQAALLALALGGLVHAALARTRAYDHAPPVWLSQDRLVLAAVRGSGRGVRRLGELRASLEAAARGLAPRVGEGVREVVVRPIARRSGPATRPSARLQAGVSRLDRSWRDVLGAIEGWARRLDQTLRLREREGADAAPDTAAPDRERLILATRRRIQRDSRDIGLAMGVLFAMWLLFLVSLLPVAGG